MTLLSATAIRNRLKEIPKWKLEQNEIIRTYAFPDFVTALRFVNQVGEKAEAMGHHPDIDIRFNQVRLALTSHDAGGLSEKDFDLAANCDSTFSASHPGESGPK